MNSQLQVHHCLTTWLQIWYHSLLWADSIRKGADLETHSCLFGVHSALMGKLTFFFPIMLNSVFGCRCFSFLCRRLLHSKSLYFLTFALFFRQWPLEIDPQTVLCVTGIARNLKSAKLWELLLWLLSRPEQYSAVIQWRNKSIGYFKLVSDELLLEIYNDYKDSIPGWFFTMYNFCRLNYRLHF